MVSSNPSPGTRESTTVRDGLTLNSAWNATTRVERSCDGQTWWYQYLPARYNKGRMVESPGVRLSMTLPHAFTGSVVVSREDGWDRFVRAIGISREFQTGSPDADAAFMLSGAIGDELAGVFQSAATHQCLRQLFELGFDRVEFFDDRVAATCLPWRQDLPDENPPETFRKAVAALAGLRTGVSMLAPGAETPGATFHHVVASPNPWSWVLGGALVAGGLWICVAVADSLSASDLLVHLGGWAAAAALAAVVLVALACRRFAFRGRTLVSLLVTVFLVVGMASLTALTYLNEWLDRSAGVHHSEVVVDKWKQSGKSTSYHIATASWRPDHPREEFTLSEDEWDLARVGASTYVVDSKPGYFGVEWLQDQSLHP